MIRGEGEDLSETPDGWLTVAQAAQASGYSMRILERLLWQLETKDHKPGHVLDIPKGA